MQKHHLLYAILLVLAPPPLRAQAGGFLIMKDGRRQEAPTIKEIARFHEK